ncbi:hypothetical protein [Pedosphaera parvula]|uniref:Fimbrial assembly family protein n=1 Tax=Pedosphaera parvula (strain Ellin514) TaxID=320771 RepID=B9XM21_PEDPL|nr:hypothetical protein [Pedosphaera parvula]EEF59149.1 Fimbrial assembly family protein [Pedosphaera parvula Ellin514]
MKNKRWQFCNVVRVGADFRQLWSFAAGRNGFNLSQEQTIPVADPLPEKLVAKDWKAVFQPKLNIAFLPVDQVFLRVIHLPTSSFDETVSMVELQLEKLSPLPVTHIAWSIYVMPQSVDNLQTVIVIMVARGLVDDMLGQLESQGYLADRIEVPMIDQLQATPIAEDGAWIYPTSNDETNFTGLVGWWHNGALRNLGLIHVPADGNSASALKEQLLQMAWAGELEGWLTSSPRWHLVAGETTAAKWQEMFQTWLGRSVEVIPPLAPAALAALTANRAAKSSDKATIIPPEYTSRYHQQYVDRLWMRILGAVVAVYVFAVLIYIATSEYQDYRAQGVEQQMQGLSASYTNALQLKARMEILQDRQALKYASLNCWKTVAELLPENLTITSMEFRNGRSLSLNGTGPAGQDALATDFSEALQKAKMSDRPDQPLFQRVDLPIIQRGPGGGITWRLGAELARGEDEQ